MCVLDGVVELLLFFQGIYKIMTYLSTTTKCSIKCLSDKFQVDVLYRPAFRLFAKHLLKIKANFVKNSH